MDSRTAGRHHTTRQWNQRYRPTLLLLDSPGPDFPGPDFPGDDGRAGAPGRPGPPGDAARRSPGGSPDRRRWLAMTASAVLVGLTVIAAFA
ncbi:MAG: hypothetical protein JO242_08030, partial [Streptosporangiaceae bacterium]|nr:hypothetical protein [Streptosporangiaceae bacterium]